MGQIKDHAIMLLFSIKLCFSYSFLGPPVDKQLAIENEPLLEGSISKEVRWTKRTNCP